MTRRREVQSRLRAGFDDAARALSSVLDAEQEPAADALARLGAQRSDRSCWRWPRRATQGVYLHGPVGRGKTWLVDALLAQLPAEGVLRMHAFEAARRLHREVARRAGTPNATEAAMQTLLDGVRLVFLDELHAHDPGDAMLLSRLVRAMRQRRTVLVATSNYSPQGLLPDPRYHHLVLPLVAVLEQQCDVIQVAGPVDHRRLGHGGGRPGWSSGGWATPGSASQLAALGLPMPEVGDRVRLHVGGHPLWAMAADSQRVHLDFAELCQGRTAVGDMLELADRYATVVIAGVPRMSAVDPDARRRFADLIDVLWDRDVRLVVLAGGTPADVLDSDITDGARTASRLSLLPQV
jgi:cell division protein ZapE